MKRADAKRGVSLKRLLGEAGLAGGEFIGCDDIRVTSCVSHSEQCLPGDLFVAIDGAEADGHDYVCDALNRGAAAVLCERDTPTAGTPYCVVNDTREIYGRLLSSFAGRSKPTVESDRCHRHQRQDDHLLF